MYSDLCTIGCMRILMAGGVSNFFLSWCRPGFFHLDILAGPRHIDFLTTWFWVEWAEWEVGRRFKGEMCLYINHMWREFWSHTSEYVNCNYFLRSWFAQWAFPGVAAPSMTSLLSGGPGWSDPHLIALKGAQGRIWFLLLSAMVSPACSMTSKWLRWLRHWS